MPAFAELQREFRAALGRPARSPADVTAADPGEAARRFAVYRNNVAWRSSRRCGGAFR